MDRRDFVRKGTLLGAAGAALPGVVASTLTGETASGASAGGPVGGASGSRPELVFRRARIVDGTGAPSRLGDVAVTAGRITTVGRVREPGLEEIDLDGLVLAPGFIDIHSHADLELLIEPRAESRIRQGVTLEVVGQDGSSILWSREEARRTARRYARDYGIRMDFRDLGGFLDHLDRNPVAVNVASMVGHGSVRGAVVGGADRPASPAEIAGMRRLVRQALDQGAVGLSSGLEYTPGSFAPREELVALASELAGTGLPYASHMRNEDDRLLSAVEETIHVGRAAGVPVQISHLKAQGRRNYWKAGLALEMIEHARGQGVDVHFDRYPYVAYATGLSSLFPPWAREGGTDALLRRIRNGETGGQIREFTTAKVALLGSWDSVQITSTNAATAWARGRRLGELAAERGTDGWTLAVRLMAENRGGVGMIGFGMSEENTARFLAHPLCMPCSDGGAYAPYGPLSTGSPHPRGYGSFPRILGRYVRELGLVTLEEAVRKMTSLPAAKLGLDDRGRLAPGMVADLVAFDPARVSDTATFESPHGYPVGIVHVVVNGSVTIREGEQTGTLSGRSVRGRRYQHG